MFIDTYFRKPDFSPELPSKVVIRHSDGWVLIDDGAESGEYGFRDNVGRAIEVFVKRHRLSLPQFSEHYILAKAEVAP